MRQDNLYKTKDIFEAAWIHSQNIQLLYLEKDGNYSWFNFDDSELICKKLSSEYWSQIATGNIKQFVNSFKTLKDLVFSQKQE